MKYNSCFLSFVVHVFCPEDFTHLIVDRANASIGSIHFLIRGSSGGKRSRISSEARITEFAALTKRTWSAILNRLHAPSMSFLFKASIAGITVCSIVALSGSTTSNPWTQISKMNSYQNLYCSSTQFNTVFQELQEK